ncbi:hypothetical protein K491DRAFT_610042 [Lophiostoma macrostomum CBS 122681]|uniref:DUF2306 domain-containing protein n=1 Tax=Lophiostoma macrostomum CBS 122681 TaxID=1314788 RepID=A0A6A6SQA8_9PLEO|nr:hypothetical protein K491DRAFT_610042 [Lophiostoma macrostomum CBS 122681]
MVAPTRPPRNGFNTFMRRIYNPIGFSKAYNFILWFIFAGAFFGFTLSRLMYLNLYGIFCAADAGGGGAAPGECYYYLGFTQEKIGIILHLGGVLPASILAVIQFIPAVRHRAIIVHRINGYLALLLYVVSLVGVFMIARHAFGGGLDIQSWIGTLAIMTMGSFVLAWVNIKRLQIEEHRAWMLRGWFYAGCIITIRFIMIISAIIVSSLGTYYTSRPCAQLAYIYSNSSTPTTDFYPICEAYFDGSNPTQEAVVKANMDGEDPNQIGVALGMSFGMACWVALAIHAIGVEVYLHLTPRETERLRKVSYQRQLEAGMSNPGSAGLVVQKYGDAEPWIYKEEGWESKAKRGSGLDTVDEDTWRRSSDVML